MLRGKRKSIPGSLSQDKYRLEDINVSKRGQPWIEWRALGRLSCEKPLSLYACKVHFQIAVWFFFICHSSRERFHFGEIRLWNHNHQRRTQKSLGESCRGGGRSLATRRGLIRDLSNKGQREKHSGVAPPAGQLLKIIYQILVFSKPCLYVSYVTQLPSLCVSEILWPDSRTHRSTPLRCWQWG